MVSFWRSVVVALALAMVAAGCGGGTDAASEADAAPAPVADAGPGIALVDPAAAQQLLDEPPSGLVVLDVRTPEEFAEGHIAGAELLDFYQPDFSNQVADLSRDTPYLVYCRSGNRSGQTRALMEQLGFTEVYDLDGGIVSWTNAGGAVQ